MSKKCTIQYRQLKIADLGDGIDLKALLVDVLNRSNGGRQRYAENARLRIIDLDQDKSFVILNKLSDPTTWSGPVFCGQLIHLQDGSDVQAVMQSLDDDTEEFVLQNLDLGEQARVLKGAMYFAISGNHLAIIEGHQVKGRTLERYLTVLLQQAGELEPGDAIILNSSFQTGDGKELSESAELTIAARPNPGAKAEEISGIVEREAAEARKMGATVFDVLRTLGWDEQALRSLEQDVPDDGWIEGLFKVFIKEKRRRRPISRATINEALRNIDPADLGLRGGGSEKNGIVKLSTTRTVQTSAGSLLDPSDAMTQIVEALREWALAGKIDCTFDGLSG